MKNQSLKSGADNSAQTSEALDARDFSVNENADYGAQNADAAKNLDENARIFRQILLAKQAGGISRPASKILKIFLAWNVAKIERILRKRKIIRTGGILRRRKTYQVRKISLASKI